MKKSVLLICAAMSFGVFEITACKKNSSNLKTLDNLASGKRVRTNRCSADPRSGADLSGKGVLGTESVRFIGASAATLEQPNINAVVFASTSVPKAILKHFAHNGGLVVVADDSKGICQSQLPTNYRGSSADRDIGGCLVVRPATDKSRATLNIFVPPGPDEIYHHLPRLFAIYASEFALAGDQKLNDWFNGVLPEITMAYLQDVQSSRFDLKSAISEIAPNADIGALNSALQKSNLPSYDSISQFIGLGSDKSLAIGSSNRRMHSFVFSHAFDSFYCNSWAEMKTADLEQIRSGKNPKSQLASVTNTREIMRVLFPRSYEIFSTKIASRIESISVAQVRQIYSAPSSAPASGAFNLSDNNPYMTRSFWFKDAPSAFFGSIWDNTGGAVASGYKSYSESVERAVDRNYSGGNIVTETAKGVAGGLADSYVQNVYNPIAEKTDQRFETQMNGGASVNQAMFNSVNLAVGDVLGTTPLVEGVAGIDTADARTLNGMERVQRVANGTATLAGNAALVAGFTPYAGRPVAGGAAASQAGAAPTAAQIEANAAAARTLGVPEKYVSGVGSAFEAGAEVQTLKPGDVLYRQYGGGSKPASYWYSTQPYANPIQDLALPASNPANKVAAFKVTQETQVLTGGVAPQNKVPGFASNAYGGGSQIYVPNFESSLQRINPYLTPGVTGGVIGQTPNVTPVNPSNHDD